MLTDLEIKTFDFIYSGMCNRFSLIPMSWENGRLRLKSKRNIVSYGILCSIILFQFIFRLKQISMRVHRREIEAALPQILCAIRCYYHIVICINFCIFPAEFVRATNQCLEINAKWGNKLELKYNIFVMAKLCIC